MLKVLNTQKCLCLKSERKLKENKINFFKNIQKKSDVFRNFKCLLISLPKCIELNSELIKVLGLGFGPHPGPRPNIYFFWGEMSDQDQALPVKAYMACSKV